MGSEPMRWPGSCGRRRRREAKASACGRPVAYLSDLRCLVQEEVPGISLYDEFLREKDATPVARKAARALAALHLDEDVPRPRRKRPSKEDFDRRLMRIGQLFGGLVPIWEGGPGDRRRRGRQARSRNPNRADSWRPPFTAYLPRRRPPRPDRPRRVRRGRSATGHRPHLIRPRRHASRFSLSRARARKASQAFVEEYFAHVPESWRDGFPTRYARAVLKRAAKISRTQSQIPGWSDKVEALIKEAKSSLAGQDLR